MRNLELIGLIIAGFVVGNVLAYVVGHFVATARNVYDARRLDAMITRQVEIDAQKRVIDARIAAKTTELRRKYKVR